MKKNIFFLLALLCGLAWLCFAYGMPHWINQAHNLVNCVWRCCCSIQLATDEINTISRTFHPSYDIVLIRAINLVMTGNGLRRYVIPLVRRYTNAGRAQRIPFNDDIEHESEHRHALAFIDDNKAWIDLIRIMCALFACIRWLSMGNCHHLKRLLKGAKFDFNFDLVSWLLFIIFASIVLRAETERWTWNWKNWVEIGSMRCVEQKLMPINGQARL